MGRLLALSLVLVAAEAVAQDAPPGPDLRDLQQARNFGMGGAYEALGYGLEAIGGNPAALSLYKRYQIELSGAWDPHNSFGTVGVGLADSVTNQLAVGLSYQFVTFGETQRRYAHLTTFAMALPLADVIHLGLVGRHHVITGFTNTNSITIDVGVVVRPLSFLTVGFSGHNLIPNFNADIIQYFVASVAGTAWGQLSPAFDLRMDFNGPNPRFAYSFGAEWLISQTFPLRAGYTHDDIANHRYVSGGIGYFSDGSGIDFGYRHEIGGAKSEMLALTLKLQL